MKMFLCGLLMLSWVQPCLANPLDAYGIGGRAPGMAGAYTAFGNDVSGTYYNPAGLTGVTGLSLELGYTYYRPSLQFNGVDLGVDSSHGLQGGLVMGGRVLGRRIAAGLSLHMPDGVVSRIRALPQSQPRFVVYDNRPQRMVLSTSLAFEVVKGLSIGAGLSFLANTTGTLDIAGDVAFFDSANTVLMTAVDVSLTAIRYPSFGIQYRLGDRWRFGLTYRETFTLKLDLAIRVHGDIVNDEAPDDEPVVENASFDMTARNANFFSPRQLAFGVAYVAPRITVSVDLTWVQWSAFPAPSAELVLGLDLGGLPFNMPPVDNPVAPGFHDILVTRLGVEYTALDGPRLGCLLRAGYGYEPTPAPDQPGETNYIDSDKHLFSLGLSFAVKGLEPILSGPLTFQFATQFIWFAPRNYQKLNPADAVGSYRASGFILGGTFVTKVGF
jgi:long-subunit fatty acid transport protein